MMVQRLEHNLMKAISCNMVDCMDYKENYELNNLKLRQTRQAEIKCYELVCGYYEQTH